MILHLAEFIRLGTSSSLFEINSFSLSDASVRKSRDQLLSMSYKKAVLFFVRQLVLMADGYVQLIDGVLM